MKVQIRSRNPAAVKLKFLPGLPGPQGERGLQGIQGVQGVQGIPGNVSPEFIALAEQVNLDADRAEAGATDAQYYASLVGTLFFDFGTLSQESDSTLDMGSL